LDINTMQYLDIQICIWHQSNNKLLILIYYYFLV
jgi:hypothetical protein